MKILCFVFGALGLVVVAAIATAWAPDRPVAELTARWARPPSRFLDVAGMTLHVRDEGPRDDASPIVLIHGTSASLHTWDGWARVLSARRRVIRFDLPGFGLTGPAPDGRYTIDSYVQVTAGLLDRLGVKHFTIGGNSLGGNVAWATALALPDRVEKLILVDSAGYPMASTSVPIGFRVARMPLVNRVFEFLLPRGLIEASVKNVYGDPGRVTPEIVDRYYELSLREGNRRALLQRFEQSDFGAQAHRIRELKLPTLILWGGRDRLIPPGDAERFQWDISGSERVTFAELGHVPQEEDPARTVAAVERFLEL
ncbi:MAG: alpha/beta hydrolase [Betaproteobacteria bacterium]|nr:alpha/beta hydrolase [Betaproteobacteria bacterium]